MIFNSNVTRKDWNENVMFDFETVKILHDIGVYNLLAIFFKERSC